MANKGKMKTDMAKKMLSDWLNKVVPMLADEGEKIILSAYDDSNNGSHIGLDWVNVDENGLPSNYPTSEFSPPNWKNVSGNLKDAYGCAVYVYGKLQVDTMRFAGAAASTNTYKGEDHDEFKGREAITNYLRGFKANANKVLTLVCANAAPYTKSLEDGDTWGGNEYVVISHIHDDMSDLLSKFGNKGSFRSIGL